MNRSLKNTLIVCGVVTLFSSLFHLLRVIPNDWGSFLLWLPILWIIPIFLGSLEYFTERKKTDGNF